MYYATVINAYIRYIVNILYTSPCHLCQSTQYTMYVQSKVHYSLVSPSLSHMQSVEYTTLQSSLQTYKPYALPLLDQT